MLRKRSAPPDGGWGWVAIFSGAVMMALTWGQQKTFGIYMLDIIERTGSDVSQTSSIQGLNIALSLAVGRLITKCVRNCL